MLLVSRRPSTGIRDSRLGFFLGSGIGFGCFGITTSLTTCFGAGGSGAGGAATISTMLWMVTGIYIWARRPRKRFLGGLCLVAGSLLFTALAVLMCR